MGLPQCRKGRPAGKSSELYIGDFCTALVEAAGNRHSGKAADASRPAEFFFVDSGYDGGVTDHPAEESRPKAQTPRVNIAAVWADSLSQAPQIGLCIEL